jgi:hypothetical protein
LILEDAMTSRLVAGTLYFALAFATAFVPGAIRAHPADVDSGAGAGPNGGP